MTFDWRHPLRHWLWVAGFCAVISLLTNSIWPRNGYLHQFGYSLCIGTLSWAIIEFGRHVINADGRRGWPRGWRGLLLTVVGLGGGFYFGTQLANALFGEGTPSTRDYTISLVITLIAGVAISHFFYAHGKQSELAAKIAAAQRDASEARLKLLEVQLEPHMLFNTLANLRALIATDPPRAIAMLDRLNRYLRTTLAGSQALSHPLATEFERVADYLELMAVRMGERLRFTLDLPDELRSVPVPALLLQPLVENAIRHGLEPKLGGGQITLRARREGDGASARLAIEVADTGVGLAPESAGAAPPGRGFGLAQVRERLATLYGAAAAIELIAAPAGGTGVTVTFPLRT